MTSNAERPLDKEVLRQMFSRSQSRDYWRELNPTLHVEGGAIEVGANEGIAADSVLSDGDIARQAARMQREGWFQVDAFFAPDRIARLLVGIENLRSAGWLPVFILLYDELWTLTQSSAMRSLIDAMLGPGSKQQANVWSHYVSGETGGKGWYPHPDYARGLQDDGSPHSLTVWIPLTDATLENGCIYLIPGDRIAGGAGQNLLTPSSFSRDEVCTYLQAALALPARAGAMLGWQSNIIHWGSHVARIPNEAPPPRVSIGLHYQREGLKAGYPTLDRDSPIPSFETRLSYLGFQLKEFMCQEQHPQAPEYLALGALYALSLGNMG